MHPRHYFPLIALLVGCDRLLEGPGPVTGRLTTRLDLTALSVSQGDEATVRATVTKTGSTTGPVTLSVVDLPAGVTATVEGQTTQDSITTATVRIQVANHVVLGVYFLKVRSRSAPLTDDVALLRLEVTPLTRLTLSLSRATLTIVRGGRAPLTVNLVRANFPAPVLLSLEAPSGVSGSFAANPLTGPTTLLTLTIASAVAPGTYNLKVRSTAAGAPDQEAALTLTVTTDPIQVLVGADQNAGQGTQASADIIVNRSGYTGSVTLSVENLPAGVTGVFQPPAPQDDSSVLLLSVGALAIPGEYSVTVRGVGSGVPDAVTTFRLTVAATSISLSLGPQSLSLLPGTTATTKLLLSRAGFDGPAAVLIDAAPAGLSAVPADPSVAGTEGSLTVTAAGTLAPGSYTLTVRAVPQLPTAVLAPDGARASLGEATAQLLITVHPLPTAAPNVVLSATGCTPDWVGYQDGSGPWIQVLPSSDQFAFSVTSDRGAYAVVKRDSLLVRYATQAELTATPIALCTPPAPTKTVSGTARHTNSFETGFNWFFGGSTATSTPAFPVFTLTGVLEGMHDLVGWGTVNTLGLRMLIRRDVDLADGGSLGEVNLAGPEGFTPSRPFLSVFGGISDRVSHTMHFLTGPSCDPARLYTTFAFQSNEPNNQQMGGVPALFLRGSDFHLLTILAQAVDGSGTTRTRTVSLRGLGTRSEALPPHIPIPAIVSLPGSFKRLQGTLAFVPSVYNGARTFAYTAGARTASVSASALYSGDADVQLGMPELSGVSGWPVALEIPMGATGVWTLTAENAATPQLCTDGRAAVATTRTGTF